MKRIEELPTDAKDSPMAPVTIKDCGEVKAASAETVEPVKGESDIVASGPFRSHPFRSVPLERFRSMQKTDQ